MYIENLKRKKHETAFNFLIRIFNDFGNIKNLTFPRTYDNIENFGKENYNCNKNYHRSFDDICLLLKTYYPNITDRKVAKILEKIINSRKLTGFLFCREIKKWVFYSTIVEYWKVHDNYVMNYSNSIDKVNIKGDGKYCMNDILKLMKE